MTLGIRRLRLPILALLLGLGALLPSGCGEKADPLSPPEIYYGEDICDACGMIISDERYAAATIVEGPEGPEPRRFDDVGDLIEYHLDRPELVVLAWYVHDYDSLEWLDAETAYFLRSRSLRSPMGFGLAAFEDQARALEQAENLGGQVLDFETLLRESKSATGHRD